MRKRILACIILTLWLISTLSVTALAFPFNEFKTEDNTLFISDLYDYYTDYEEFIADQGLMLARTIQYKGMGPEGARPMYTQSARLEIALPDGYFDYLKISHKTDPENHWFDCWEGDTWYNEYVVNKVYYSLHQDCSVTLHEVEPYGDDRGKSAAELMEKEVDTYRNMKMKQTNSVEDPITIRQERDGYSIILHEQEPTVFGMRSDGKPISFDYDIFDCVIDTWTYVRFMTFSELPGIYVKAVYVMYVDKSIEIRDSANKKPCDTYPNGDWEPYYHTALDRISGFLNENMGEKFLDMDSRISITWNEPEIDPSYKGSDQEEDTTQNIGVTQSAEQNPGEDDGVVVSDDIVEGSSKKDSDSDKGSSKSGSVKSSHDYDDDGMGVGGAIAVGVLSTGAAVGAGAAATSSGKGKNNNGKKKKSYKMYVQKDFGDAIRRGAAKPVKIRARMAEVDENGVSRDRNDLTALIGVSGDGMTIHDAALVGRYCEATVSVPENNYNDTANIIFTFNGEGGTFTNTVIFRLVDGPSLKFVEETETPGTFNLYTAVKYVDMIPGDGFTYAEQFMIVDAPVPPEIEDMTADKVEGYDVRFEMTDRQYVYKVIIKNNTPPLAEEQKDLFAEPKQENLTFHVKVQGEKEPVDGYVTMFMYQEGITVASDQKAKKKGQTYVRIQAYEKENVGDLAKKWQVSQMKFTLAVKGKDKSIINPAEAKYKFEKLKGAGGIGTTADKEDALAEKYKFIGTPCEINEKPGYQFEPQANLSEPTDGTFFMVLLPTFVTYEHKEYQAEIPLRLRGKDVDPMADWEKEFEDLKRRIEKFSLPGNKDAWLARMESCALEPRVSVEELRLVSKWIIREYMTYWTSQGEKALSEARMYNVIVNTLEWTKFAGDCAFSFLVAAYAGPVAEALISPAKDFITGAIGEVIAAKAHGEAVDVDNFEFSKNLAAAGDNLVSNNISLTDWRKAAATLAGYFCYAAIKNYLTKLNEKGESDFYGALCEGFKDMTLAALKSKAGDLIGKWLKDSKKFQETIGPKIASYFKETNMDTLQKKLNDALGLEGELRKLAGYANDKVVEATVKDVVEKYIGNLVGAGFDKLRETYDKSKFGMEGTHVTYCFNIELFDAFSFGVKLDLTQILLNTNGMFFGWFYDLFFAGVPAASSVINAPKDPELPPIQA